jgi:hypothetical protein
LELAAYDSLIHDKHFQKTTIPQKAEDFVVRLSCALSTFFPVPVNALRDPNFETWSQEKIVWEDRKFRMKEIFQEALKLKAETLLSDEVFDFIVHWPGGSESPHDLTHHDTNNSQGEQLQIHGQEYFHTVASFHIYSPVISVPRDPMADALVRPRNFLDRAISTRTDKPLYTRTVRVQNSEFSNLDEEVNSVGGSATVNGAANGVQKEVQRGSQASGQIESVAKPDQIPTTEERGSEKPIKCQTCLRSFKVKGSLANHVRLSKQKLNASRFNQH